MGWLARDSHPVASTDGTVGIRSVNASTRSTFEHLAARAGNSIGFGSSRLSSSSIGTGGTGLLFVVIGLSGGLGNGLGVLLVLVHGPIEDVVVLESFTDEEVAENLTEVAVVRLVVESEGSSVVEVDGELVGEATAKDLGRCGHLLLHDTVILLLLGGSLKSLPGKRSSAEVEHDISKGLHIIAARLLNTKVGVDRGISSGTSKVLVLSVRNVEVGLGVAVLFGKTEVDDVDLVSTLANAHQEVIGLDITVNERLGMDVLDARNQLVSKKEDSLQRKLSVAEVEKILQTGAKEIQDHGIVVTLGSEPTNEGNTNSTGEGLVDAGFIFKLRVLGLDRLKLDSNLLTGDDVSAEINITKRTGTDLATDAVFVTDAKIL